MRNIMMFLFFCFSMLSGQNIIKKEYIGNNFDVGINFISEATGTTGIGTFNRYFFSKEGYLFVCEYGDPVSTFPKIFDQDLNLVHEIDVDTIIKKFNDPYLRSVVLMYSYDKRLFLGVGGGTAIDKIIEVDLYDHVLDTIEVDSFYSQVYESLNEKYFFLDNDYYMFIEGEDKNSIIYSYWIKEKKQTKPMYFETKIDLKKIKINNVYTGVKSMDDKIVEYNLSKNRFWDFGHNDKVQDPLMVAEFYLKPLSSFYKQENSMVYSVITNILKDINKRYIDVQFDAMKNVYFFTGDKNNRNVYIFDNKGKNIGFFSFSLLDKFEDNISTNVFPDGEIFIVNRFITTGANGLSLGDGQYRYYKIRNFWAPVNRNDLIGEDYYHYTELGKSAKE